MGLSINNYPSGFYAQNLTAEQKCANYESKNDEISFQSSKNDSVEISQQQCATESKNEKVSFSEGIGLVGKGFWDKICDIGRTIKNNPLKALAAVGITSLALAALPLIGITAATGGAILALGFGAYAAFNTVKDVVKAVKHNGEGNYDAVRQDLQNIGGDGVDIALSLPFVPKAINQVKRFAKYGKSSFGLNKELIANLKNAKSIGDVRMEFAKARTSIDYDLIANEMGLKIRPKLVFKDLPANPKGIMLGGAFDPLTGEMQINKNLICGKGKLLARMSKIDQEQIIRHELEHFRQFSDIARTEGLGVDGLSNALTEYYTELNKLGTPSEFEKIGISPETIENMVNGDKSVFNREFYQQIVDAKGTISAGTNEAELANQYAKGLIQKVKPSAEDTEFLNQACAGLNPKKPFDQLKIQKAQHEMYKRNILEKEAFEAQDIFTKQNIRTRPGFIINNMEALSAFSDNGLDKIA